MKIKCIDLSEHNGVIDFAKVKKAGITTVILRAGYGRHATQIDELFNTYYLNAKRYGLKIGCYWFSYSENVTDSLAEAKACYTVIKNKKFDLPVYYDVETAFYTKRGKNTATKMVEKFCNYIKSKGFNAGVYANLNFFSNYLNYERLKKKYSIWLAQYYTENQLECDIWQYSSTGKINGITGNVDLNEIFNAGVFSTTDKTETKPSTQKKTYKQGDKLKLKNVALYGNASATKKVTSVTGTYYVYDGIIINNKIRITNSIGRVGKMPMSQNVTGFIKI